MEYPRRTGGSFGISSRSDGTTQRRRPPLVHDPTARAWRALPCPPCATPRCHTEKPPMTEPASPTKSDNEIQCKLGELGDEFGVHRFPKETNAEFAHRLLAELADMIAELQSSQRLIQQLVA